MSRADYAHWNEEADHIWWQEEGRFGGDDGYYSGGGYLDDDPYYPGPDEESCPEFCGTDLDLEPNGHASCSWCGKDYGLWES